MFLRSHHWYPSYFHVVVRLGWAYDPDSYAGGSITTVIPPDAEQVKGDDPN
jgi:hypothetical protein